MKRMSLLAMSGLLVAVIGCSDGAKLASVSGVVKLDGKPYGKAVVSFQPIGTKDNANPGRGSSAYTDENGRYVLKCDGTQNGAVVGKHQVRIMTRGSDNITADPDAVAGSSDDTSKQKREVDPIPAEWHSRSNKEFDVPSGGTDKADFDITSISAGGGKK